jgi:hypothetical protein
VMLLPYEAVRNEALRTWVDQIARLDMFVYNSVRIATSPQRRGNGRQPPGPA